MPASINRKDNSKRIFLYSFLLWALVSLACGRRVASTAEPFIVSGIDISSTVEASLTATADNPSKPQISGLTENEPNHTPTPDESRILPTLRSEPEQYVVNSGDTLLLISRRYQVSIKSLVEANNLSNPDLLEVGQILLIPKPEPGIPGTGFKVIPDSELVYSPLSVDFLVNDFVHLKQGYLDNYSEEVEGEVLSGSQIVVRIAQEFSVNPRLLLAVLEYQSGWVTQANPLEDTLLHPILVAESWRKGLYLQLAYAANNLNRGFYLWQAGAIGYWVLADGEIVPIDSGINAGTAGVQQFFANISERSEWDKAVSDQGLYATYQKLFGYPFASVLDPLVPSDLSQPKLQLPFETGEFWSFTGGPHGGWGDGSAWAALDFAPPGDALGCVSSDSWAVAAADGLIIRTGNGAVIQDLDMGDGVTNDGLEQTGWVILYMHIETRDRIQPGTYVRAGERIGHPSCEGGQSSGTHVHIARRYNGVWIPADGYLPFVLDGWVSSGDGNEYDGFLTKVDVSIEAWEGNFPENRISR